MSDRTHKHSTTWGRLFQDSVQITSIVYFAFPAEPSTSIMRSICCAYSSTPCSFKTVNSSVPAFSATNLVYASRTVLLRLILLMPHEMAVWKRSSETGWVPWRTSGTLFRESTVFAIDRKLVMSAHHLPRHLVGSFPYRSSCQYFSAPPGG